MFFFKKLVIVFIILFLFTSFVSAATINANSCSQQDVQAAIDSANDLDTILVPGGNCIWNGAIALTKKIIIQGAGIDSTTLTKTPPETIFNLAQSGSRVTGFNFINGSISADGDNWRIDHCNFSFDDFVSGITIRGNNRNSHPKGLVDHCNFLNGRVGVLGWAGLISHEFWAQPTEFGSYKAVYIEDCEYLGNRHSNVVDTNYGGMYVFRNNQVTDSYLEAHSLQGTHRATRKFEIYNNEISQIYRGVWVPMFLRGGPGVIFNNNISGFTLQKIAFDNVRSCAPRGDGGQCNGGSLWDGNEPLEIGGLGAHDGNDGASVLQDISQNWAVDSLIGMYVYNLADGSKGSITANTDNTVTAQLSDGTNNFWNSGNNYKITDGYPCRDQIGRGTDEWLWTDQSPYPPQKSEPVYLWNNKHPTGNVTIQQHNCPESRQHIQPNRDYFEEHIKPGYKPYIYPHPLTVAPLGTEICGEGEITSSCWCEGIKSSDYCCHGYYENEDCDGPCVPLTQNDILLLIDDWKNGNVNIDYLINKLKEWKTGC